MLRYDQSSLRRSVGTSRRSFFGLSPFLTGLGGDWLAAATSDSLEKRLFAELENLEIADTHEHFFDERDRITQRIDFFALVQAAYTGSDLVSAGMPAEASRIF